MRKELIGQILWKHPNPGPTSTKFATLPSSSTPRVLKRVPALFQLSREIRLIVAIFEPPEPGDAGIGTVNIPTYPWIARTYGRESVMSCIPRRRRFTETHDESTPVQVGPLVRVQLLSKVQQAPCEIFVPYESFIKVGIRVHVASFFSGLL